MCSSKIHLSASRGLIILTRWWWREPENYGQLPEIAKHTPQHAFYDAVESAKPWFDVTRYAGEPKLSRQRRCAREVVEKRGPHGG